MYRTEFWTLWEKARVGCSEIIALKQVYYQGWNRPPSQVKCMRQVLWAGALGRPRGVECGRRQEGGSGWGIHVNSWLIHVNVWQKPLQYCKVISLQQIKINGKKKEKRKKRKNKINKKLPCQWDAISAFRLIEVRIYDTKYHNTMWWLQRSNTRELSWRNKWLFLFMELGKSNITLNERTFELAIDKEFNFLSYQESKRLFT